ncbi:cytochrome-c peroxidase [Botrimarina mediterranea]|uniref:Cytochrome c551 peroxidase n=1 Tax=Botrimarina mediterranea TaxID=2528022 RepID=A0A518KF08_9BACT|nr:cytochrome c peroxidase [Botrimarina mediterranea]QDV76380.1 Cytochrome c551 peroxidase precursor [Botrimarina mediterranea]QDV80977.1 Cytochrome c551 peroxidase precursor [Planctomycetes bacterium K2D]
MLRFAALLFCAALAGAATADGPERVRLGEGNLLSGVPGEGKLTVEQLRGWLADPVNHRELRPELPLGMNAGEADMQGLDAEPLTRAKIELGRQLFFDPRLSRDGTVSCASCHAPEYGYAFPTRFGVGVDGQEGVRNSPTAANRILSGAQFWDGRVSSLEEQAIAPMANPQEMGFSHGAIVETLKKVPAYVAQFDAVFDGGGVSIDNAGRALAAFERVLVSGPNAWDVEDRLRVLREAYADEDPELADELAQLEKIAAARPLSDAAKRGADLFFGARTGCTQCHAGANFSDEAYHNLGVGMESIADLPEADAITKPLDWGRYEVTKDEADRGAFKTPGLRNVAETGPYMHDGSLETLDEVVAWYVKGGQPNPFLSPLIEPLNLTAAEQADLVAFLEELSGEWPEVETERLP